MVDQIRAHREPSAIEDSLQQTEERLAVALAQSGDRTAFRRLVDLYDRRLFYFIRRIVGNAEDAFDILQTVWLKVHRQIGSLQSPSAFRVWIYRIAHSQSVSELRRKSSRPILIEELNEFDAEPTVGEEVSDTFEKTELVHIALDRMSVDQRRILTLRFLEEMTIDEIALVVGVQSGTVKSRLHYAKLALHAKIKELLDE